MVSPEAPSSDISASKTVLGQHWEHFPHDADIGIRGIGATKEEAFEQAALALSAVITDLHDIVALEEITVDCEAPDNELLLAEWLNALIYQMATRRMLFSRFEVRIDSAHLSGKAWGEPINVERHKPAVEVKGATYTQLKVEHNETGAGWRSAWLMFSYCKTICYGYFTVCTPFEH